MARDRAGHGRAVCHQALGAEGTGNLQRTSEWTHAYGPRSAQPRSRPSPGGEPQRTASTRPSEGVFGTVRSERAGTKDRGAPAVLASAAGRSQPSDAGLGAPGARFVDSGD